MDTLTPALALEEEFFLGLRQLSGIELTRIEREYGVSVADKIGELAARGMMEKDGGLLRIPAAKLSVSNEIIVELLRSAQVAAEAAR